MNKISETVIKTAGNRAAGYFGNGFHCAEAVAASVLEAMGENASEAAAHATAFGGGFGGTHEEACGALSGGLIAIGHLYGRREPGGDWDLPRELGKELRQRFINSFETTHCATLCERFGEESQMDECRKLVRVVVKVLLEVLAESRDQWPVKENLCSSEKT